MNIHQRQLEKDKAEKWWNQLSHAERFDLGDDFVLGSFDWKEWGFNEAPTTTFVREVDDLRMHWESEDEAPDHPRG